MKNFEFKSQICTTKEQSKKLLALGLKKETADMMYRTYEKLSEEYRYYELVPEFYRPCIEGIVHIPAWSLHRLLCLIPKEVNIDGFKFPLRSDVIMRLEDVDFMYERLMGIIERVIKEGYFNQDYLEDKK